jgi:hypothetical protein
MPQHDVDPVSLTAGLIFMLVAGGYALSHAGNVSLDWVVVLPALLVVAGAAILAAVARRMRRTEHSENGDVTGS